MEAKQTKLTINELAIVPLSDVKTKEHFKLQEKDHSNLVNWFHTKAVICERERTSKTFVALHGDTAAGYIAISTSLLDKEIEGMKSTNKFKPQVLLIGKLYTSPDYRGRGIGKQLTQYAIGIAKVIDDMTGCIGVIVDSTPNAVGFYEGIGFKIIEKPSLITLGRTVSMYLRVPEDTIS